MPKFISVADGLEDGWSDMIAHNRLLQAQNDAAAPSVATPDAPSETASGEDSLQRRSPSELQLSSRGAQFIQSFEKGPRGEAPALSRYASLEGGADTIGYGHKIRAGEAFPGPITKERVDELFQSDLAYPQQLVRNNVRVPLSQAEYDALVSLGYNVPGALRGTSEMVKRLNAGDYAGAASEMLRWNHIGKRPAAGLTERRGRESEIFLRGNYLDHR